MARDPFTDAACRQPIWVEDAVLRRGNLWDWRVGDESEAEQSARHSQAVSVCLGCPNFVDNSCATEFEQMTDYYGEHPGVWSATIITPEDNA